MKSETLGVQASNARFNNSKHGKTTNSYNNVTEYSKHNVERGLNYRIQTIYFIYTMI